MLKNRESKFVFYTLKRKFGRAVSIYSRTIGGVNYETGEQVITDTVVTVLRAVLLPVNYKLQHNFAMFATNFKFGGDIKLGDREVLIDLKDYSLVFQQGDYLMIGGKRFNLIDWADFEDVGYHLVVRNSQDE